MSTSSTTWFRRRKFHFNNQANNKSLSFKFGERGSGVRARGEVQDFYQLRDKCLSDGVLFEDPEFPADNSSLTFSQGSVNKFQWKRPSELVKNPRFFVEGATRFDVVQGDLGDCWLLAAVANLTLHSQIFHRVVPTDQSFVEKYAGIFHFRFWQYGKWVDVVVDDRLPTVYGELVYLHSDQKNEFWSALLEKAYAKLHGCYEALKGGTSCEAMEDFTGGVTEYYELDKAPKNLYTILLKGYERSSLMGCGLKPDPLIPQQELPNGLVRGHAYSITAVKLVNIKTAKLTGKIPLVRIRNPWGKAEWKGAWSDKSREWQFIPEDQKAEIGLVFDIDGEFWMSFADFMKNFHSVELCNLDPDSLEEELLSENPQKTWQTRLFEGSWIKGITAGGCAKYRDSTFSSNPQYSVTLEHVDEGEDEDHDECTCTIIIALMQKNRRAQRRMGLDTLSIGFAVYRIENPETTRPPLEKKFFLYNLSTVKSDSFINLREVSGRYKLPPGTYCIIPSTYDSNQEGEFILRVFCEKKTEISEYDDKICEGEIDKRVERVELNAVKQAALRESFQRIAGEDLEVDAYELKQIIDFVLMKEFQFSGFGINLCRSMVAMMDTDRSGKLGMEEFKELWFSIITWKDVFKLYDKDNTGMINTFKLRNALESAGYRLNWHVMNILGLRHSNKAGSISFEDFIVCAVKLKHIIELFRDKDPQKLNRATFTLEEWIESAMYA